MFTKILIFNLFSLFVFKLSNATPRSLIVGGFFAEKNQFPYQVSLQFNKEHFCGGSIIKKDFILTAAHCVVVNEKYLESVEVVVGTIYTGSGTRHKLKKAIPHENYIATNDLHDIALLQLQDEVIISESVQIIPLNLNPIIAGMNVVISGWGSEVDNGPSPDYLKYTYVETISPSDCSEFYYEFLKVNSTSKVCLRHDLDQSACHGDSGGPAVVNGVLIGVTAAVVPDLCVNNSGPMLYADVSYYFTWIYQNTGGI